MGHTDGPSYYPFTIVISILSSCILEFYDIDEFKNINPKIKWKIFVESGSIYGFSK